MNVCFHVCCKYWRGVSISQRLFPNGVILAKIASCTPQKVTFLSNNRTLNALAHLRIPRHATASCSLLNLRRFSNEPTGKWENRVEKLRQAKLKVEESILRENIFTIPNALCVSRILMSPILAYLVVNDSLNFALSLFVFAGVTDLLDGFIARRYTSQQSMLGSFLDPMADKFLIFFLVISLTWKELIPVPLTALIIIRDLCLIGAGFYIRYLSLPAPRTLLGFFDATHATAKLSPTFISKLNTTVQLGLVALTLAAPIFHYVDHIALQSLWYATAATTIVSGLSYVFTKNTYELLKRGKMKNE